MEQQGDEMDSKPNEQLSRENDESITDEDVDDEIVPVNYRKRSSRQKILDAGSDSDSLENSHEESDEHPQKKTKTK